CEQGRGDRGDALAAAGETEAVAGRPRHAHRSAHGLGQHPLGLLAASPDARAVTHDLHDGVAHDETGGLDMAPNLGEQLDPVRARPARIARAEDAAEVAEAGRRQQGVAQGVRGHVPVGVAGAAVVVRPQQARDPAVATGLDRVDVDTLADTRHAGFSVVSSASITATSNGVRIRMPCGSPWTVRISPPRAARSASREVTSAAGSRVRASVSVARRSASGVCTCRRWLRSRVARTIPSSSTTFTVSATGCTGTAATAPPETASPATASTTSRTTAA